MLSRLIPIKISIMLFRNLKVMKKITAVAATAPATVMKRSKNLQTPEEVGAFNRSLISGISAAPARNAT